MRPKIVEVLREMNFRGIFDINTIKADDGLVALEPTMRFGIPSTSYECIEGLVSDPGKLFYTAARAQDEPIEIKQEIGMVMCVVGKPWPIASTVPENTSVGERLWIIQDDEIADDFTEEQLRHIHLYNFERTEDKTSGESIYTIPTREGYILTVTASGTKVDDVRERLIKYIRANIYFAGMKYRMDIGKRVEKLISLYA
jgi:phosphoribosylamine-glycine ligase